MENKTKVGATSFNRVAKCLFKRAGPVFRLLQCMSNSIEWKYRIGLSKALCFLLSKVDVLRYHIGPHVIPPTTTTHALYIGKEKTVSEGHSTFGAKEIQVG